MNLSIFLAPLLLPADVASPHGYYVLSRRGASSAKPIADFQNTAFRLADMATTVDVMWAYNEPGANRTSPTRTEPTARTSGEGVSLVRHRPRGGIPSSLTCAAATAAYGYITEYPDRSLDARVHRI
ncbi:hypothetical protein [Microbacterium aurum]